MSADACWRFPWWWAPAQLRAAIESSAAELGATSCAVVEQPHGFDIVAYWSHEAIRRWSYPGLDVDPEVDHGELTLRLVDEGGEWNVSSIASYVEVDDEQIACHVYQLAVDVAHLASLGVRAIGYCDEDGNLGSINPHGPLISTPPAGTRFPTTPPEYEGDVRCECTTADGARWIGTDELPTGRVLRWDGHAFVAIDIGSVGMVRALAPCGGGVVAAVSALADDNGRPGFVHIQPARYGELHMTSSRGGTRFTWGVTAELATRITRRLAGIAAD